MSLKGAGAIKLYTGQEHMKTGLCKRRRGQRHGGVQVSMGKVQVLFSGNACRMGLNGGRVRDEGSSAKSP